MTKEELQVEQNLVKQKIARMRQEQSPPAFIRSAEIVLHEIERQIKELTNVN